ncbi:MAG: class I SAM-dependent methyltransferase [Candidatus Pacebacteria bacterium]|nr:class I SAM-dependent methyltransferase [Candidatus Paceibacterota bacterium]
MSYYTKWGMIIGSPIFQRFLRENYAKGLSDLHLLKRENPFFQSDFSSLLCGVGNAETARSFIEFVTNRNPNAHIFIIDLGTEQIDAVKKLVKHNFGKYDIKAQQMNALDLTTWLKRSSLDWIETDGFLEFFSPPQLQKLLKIWHTLLKKDGYITIREPASDNIWESVIDVLRVWMAKWWLGVRLYVYSLTDLKRIFHDSGFLFKTFPTKVPTFRRFTLVKSVL